LLCIAIWGSERDDGRFLRHVLCPPVALVELTLLMSTRSHKELEKTHSKYNNKHIFNKLIALMMTTLVHHFNSSLTFIFRISISCVKMSISSCSFIKSFTAVFADLMDSETPAEKKTLMTMRFFLYGSAMTRF
jgi:hypothetical protein